MSISKLQQLNLPRYLAEPEALDSLWVRTDKRRDAARGISIESYTFSSQLWPKGPVEKEGQTWRHALVFYRPDVISAAQALLFVNGGTRNKDAQQDNPQPHELDFSRLAAETQALVVDLQDVPNQYLTFEDAVSRKGDSIYAYSWNRYMSDLEKNAYWPLSLPMTKAVVKAMDAIQQIMVQEYFIPIEHFVVAGLSKRGLATWLAALHDERISAIVPIVIDTLNTQKTMKHIYASYNNNWPLAFYDFIQEKIPESMQSMEFKQLMEIEDPLAYLRKENGEFYKKRLSIPKYIISASGDDFFTPDCLSLYLDELPGETRVRLVPNQGHSMDLKIVEEALLGYFRAFIKRNPLPQVQWSITQRGALCHVLTDKPPQQVKLWEAENAQSRDFRLAAQIKYLDKNLVGAYREGFYHYPVQVNAPLQGWKAHFIELTFQERQGDPLILTTPAYVVPADHSD